MKKQSKPLNAVISNQPNQADQPSITSTVSPDASRASAAHQSADQKQGKTPAPTPVDAQDKRKNARIRKKGEEWLLSRGRLAADGQGQLRLTTSCAEAFDFCMDVKKPFSARMVLAHYLEESLSDVNDPD